jgi:hypothetical protein
MPDPYCRFCGVLIPVGRHDLGYDTCMGCGEIRARRVKHTIVPMHKSNYIVVTDYSLLTQLTRPGRN